MKKTTKHAGVLALTIGLTFGLTACDDDPQPEQQETVENSEAQENVDTSQAAYDDTYPQAKQHLIDEYGIMETAELCDHEYEIATDADAYKEFIDDLMADAGIEAEGDSREHPDYMGKYDAMEDAVYDICENHTPAG